MKLVMTLLVRDEADIVSSNIDFHLDRGVDFVIAMDNLSVDGTTDLLRAYEKCGVLRYLHQADDNYTQHRWVTTMARLACVEFAANWVINNDADEFWYPERGDLKQMLDAVPPSCHAVSAKRINFLPRPMAEGDFFADVMTVRELQSLNALGELLPAKVCHRAFVDIEVEQGNHAVGRNGHSLSVEPAPITILHFPVRSYRQFANKISKGGAAYARNPHLPQGIGSTWRYLYKVWQRGELQAHYQAAIADEESIQRGLREGNYVVDERVKTALVRLGHGSAYHNCSVGKR
jgi:hypothetical protein